MRTDRNLYTLPLARRRTGEALARFGPLLARGLRLYCLDGGNAFDPLPLVERLRSDLRDPGPVLDGQVFLSRAFTCHQLAGAAETLLGPLVGAREPTVAVILGVEAMFLDEDLRLSERRYLFGRILTLAEGYARGGLPILLTCGEGPAEPWRGELAGRTRMLRDLRGTIASLGAGVPKDGTGRSPGLDAPLAHGKPAVGMGGC